MPRAGKYAIGFLSQFYAADEMQVAVDRNQTVRIDAREKRTRLLVRVLGPDRQPVRFPPVRNVHEPPVNTVSLHDAAPPTLQHHVYPTSSIGGVDSALRPNGDGRVEFRLARGGKYRLVAAFDEFDRLERAIELTTDETTEIELLLVRR